MCQKKNSLFVTRWNKNSSKRQLEIWHLLHWIHILFPIPMIFQRSIVFFQLWGGKALHVIIPSQKNQKILGFPLQQPSNFHHSYSKEHILQLPCTLQLQSTHCPMEKTQSPEKKWRTGQISEITTPKLNLSLEKGPCWKKFMMILFGEIHTKSMSTILKSYYFSGNIFRFREFQVGFSHWDLVMPERKLLVENFHAQLSEQIVDSWSSFLAWCDLGFCDLGCFNARKLSSDFLWFWLSWGTNKAWVDGNQPEENWLFSLSKIQCLQICWWLSRGVSSQ